MGPHAPARSGRHGDTGRLRATSLFFARSLSTWSPETGAPKPASAAGARRLPGTTPTCSKSSHAKLMREPWAHLRFRGHRQLPSSPRLVPSAGRLHGPADLLLGARSHARG